MYTMNIKGASVTCKYAFDASSSGKIIEIHEGYSDGSNFNYTIRAEAISRINFCEGSKSIKIIMQDATENSFYLYFDDLTIMDQFYCTLLLLWDGALE